MFKPHYGKCIECGKDNQLIAVKRGWCQLCNYNRKRAQKELRGPGEPGEGANDIVLGWDIQKKKKVYIERKRTSPAKVYKKKPTGEILVFKEIWAERKHICQCCSERLLEEAQPSYFSHVLSKGSYVRFRLLKLNIMLMCFDCHHEWDFGDKSQDKFKLARMIAEKLKRMYYGSDTCNDNDSINDTPGC